MIFSLLVHCSPSSPASLSAQRFAYALLRAQHRLYRVFFYHDGVYQGTALAHPPADQANIYAHWQALQEQHKVDLVVCIAAAIKRGILDDSEAKHHRLSAHNLAPGMTLSGLGQLVDAIAHSDRLITFGG
ncbi:MAG: sulfurtransferase complex subunit TusD [Cellvibrionaceae bacterium]|nr:sulfurtransferase complex subunit TusD [Cellvibrionaceae bacterium]